MAGQQASHISVRTRPLMAVALGFLLALGGIAQSADQREAEIGGDFQISFMGGVDPDDGEVEYPSMAYNSDADNFLVVWRGEQDIPPLADDEYEIYGTIVTPGVAPSTHFRISTAGPDGDVDWEANDPVAAYNSTNKEFLIAWYAPDDADDDDTDIYVSRYIPSTGTVTADVEVSDTPDPPAPYQTRDIAEYPDIVYNPDANEYFVVYVASHFNTADWSRGYEIFGRCVSVSGSPCGPQTRISVMGPEPPDAAHTSYRPYYPAVAYNPAGDVYLVIWTGDTNIGSLVDDEWEIWGQLVDASSGALIGGNFRISQTGPDGDQFHDAVHPDVAADPDSGQFLAVWSDDRDTQYDRDIWGQRINSYSGALMGSNFQISETLPAGSSPQYMGFHPAPTYNQTDREFLVVWYGVKSELGENNMEIWGQRLDPRGNQIGTNDFRISHMGPDGDPSPWSWSADDPSVAWSPRRGEYLVTWNGRFPLGLYGSDSEMFGQRLMPDRLEYFVLDR